MERECLANNSKTLILRSHRYLWYSPPLSLLVAESSSRPPFQPYLSHQFETSLHMLRQAHITPQAPTETFQNYQQPSPAASATLFYRSADVQSSASQATVVCPDSSSYQTAPTTQAYTTFESLFPVRQFSNLSNMPTSILLHYLVHSFIWATSVLRGMIREHPVNYLVDPADQAGRAILMPTPLWPGGDHTLTSPLDELLQDMIPIYAILLTRGSFTY